MSRYSENGDEEIMVLPVCPYCGEEVKMVTCYENIVAAASQHKVKVICCSNCQRVLGTTLTDDAQNKIDTLFNKSNGY